MRFLHGDLEQIPLDEASVDAVISNGAFCLAPDKARAFAEVRRVLRPGGRFAVCTCADAPLQPRKEQTSWPPCYAYKAPTPRGADELPVQCTHAHTPICPPPLGLPPGSHRSTLRQPLEESVQWPVCMRMFAPMHEVALLCEAAGLVDVKVDDSDAAMQVPPPPTVAGCCTPLPRPLSRLRRGDGAQFELPEEAEAQGAAWSSAAAADGSPPPPQQQQRNAVHVGSPEFRHLQQFDMNALCARVVVTGRRPQ